MTKVLLAYSADGPPQEMARFEVSPAGEVTATYANEALRAQHEVGVFTARTGRVRIDAGRRFLEALELSLSTSSLLRLETV